MSDAPERIYIDDAPETFTDKDIWSCSPAWGQAEYLRADLVAAQVAEAVAAERERCARVVDARILSLNQQLETIAAHRDELEAKLAAAIRAGKGEG